MSYIYIYVKILYLAMFLHINTHRGRILMNDQIDEFHKGMESKK